MPATDDHGRTLEHAWRTSGGPWRPYRTGDQLVIADRLFAWQAAYTIDVRSRVVGDYTTTSPITSVDVVIDSVAPEILVEGDTFTARDLVSTSLRYAWGRPGDDVPSTDYSTDPTIDRATLEDLVVAGDVTVYVMDEASNVAIAQIPAGFHGAPSTDGCGCSSRGDTGGGILLLLSCLFAFRRPSGRSPRRTSSRACPR